MFVIADVFDFGIPAITAIAAHTTLRWSGAKITIVRLVFVNRGCRKTEEFWGFLVHHVATDPDCQVGRLCAAL